MNYKYVYAAINEIMINRATNAPAVKIGITEDVSRRIKQLSSHSSTYGKFTLLCCLRTPEDKAEFIEENIHKALSKLRVTQDREFFNINQEEIEALFSLLCLAQEIEEVSPEEIGTAYERKKRGKNFSFSDVGIKTGDVLTSVFNQKTTITVISDRKVTINDDKENEFYLSAASKMLYPDSSTSAKNLWIFNGKKLSELPELPELPDFVENG